VGDAVGADGINSVVTVSRTSCRDEKLWLWLWLWVLVVCFIMISSFLASVVIVVACQFAKAV